ncbi:MAG: metallophosphoesterase [Candidatus Helarchaeota archaeon]
MKFQELIAKFEKFDNKDSNKINELIEKVKLRLVKEPILIKLNSGSNSIIVGDLHGDFKTLQSIIKVFIDENFEKIIFLGDYIDRGFGDMQIKTINFLLFLKDLFPEKIYLLRGNHEWRYINAEYGFKDAVFHHLHPFIYYRYNEIFDELPIAIFIAEPKILAVHAGIPVSLNNKIYSLDDISKISKKNCFENKLAQQILWNDPSEKIETIKKNYRGLGYIFGSLPFNEFLNYNNLEYCIRSHEIIKSGNIQHFNGKLITIFSSRSYIKNVKPHILLINKNTKLEFREINSRK